MSADINVAEYCRDHKDKQIRMFADFIENRTKKIQDLEAKLSSQWDSGYRHGAKEASGKIKSLETKLAQTVEALRDAAEYIGNYGSEWKEEQLIKTLEEIEKGD